MLEARSTKLVARSFPLSCGFQRHGRRQRDAPPPQQSAEDDQADRDHLGSAHPSQKIIAPAGIAAEELDEVAADAVDDHVGPNDLALELLAPDQPHQENAVAKF